MNKQGPASPPGGQGRVGACPGSSAAQLSLLGHLQLPSIPPRSSQSQVPTQLILGDTVFLLPVSSLRPVSHQLPPPVRPEASVTTPTLARGRGLAALPP